MRPALNSVLTFEPILKERIWGGRNLEKLYAKRLPPRAPIGESWEISDRPGDESVVTTGPWKGTSLHQLMEEQAALLLGPGVCFRWRQRLWMQQHPGELPPLVEASAPFPPVTDLQWLAAAKHLPEIPARFPLLIKIIDARQTLSLQVHPPALQAAQLGGEPKTEMWYIAQAEPDAELFVGLKKGVTRADFEKQLSSGTVADCFHRIPVKAGDAMFLPSGRVHAVGAGTLIFEIQQNSDTTYRVFDWNRVDAAGRPRALHLPQSLASIDFEDFEPSLLPSATFPGHPGTIRPLVKDKLFQAGLRRLKAGDALPLHGGHMRILGVVEGALRINNNGDESAFLSAGQFCLIPACCTRAVVEATSDVAFLQVEPG